MKHKQRTDMKTPEERTKESDIYTDIGKIINEGMESRWVFIIIIFYFTFT